MSSSELSTYLNINGRGVKINSVTDLNNFYNSVALFNGNVTNNPIGDWCMVIAAGVSGTTVQLAVPLFAQSKPTYIRYCASNTWSTWFNPFRNQYVVERRTGTLSNLAMYASTNVSISVSKSGYIPIGIVGFSGGGSATSVYATTLTSSTATLSVANWSTVAQSGTCYVDVLYQLD